MIVSGYGVTREGEREDMLVNTADMFATLADIANTGTTQIHNSYSFKDAFTKEDSDKRNYAYGEVGS